MTAAVATERAALYARISLDDLGLEKGVKRQLEDARELAAQRGWSVIDEYVDNDVSAYSGALRGSYRRLMADAEAGRFDRIVVWQSSRLWRSRSERASAIDLLGKLRIGVAAVKGPELDLTTAYGRMIAGVMGEFDTAESEVKGERVSRAVLQRAQAGIAHGPVAYGWRREYEADHAGRIVSFHDVENAEEAVIVREIVDRLLKGDALRAITRDLNERDVLIPNRSKSGAWKPQMVAQVAKRPANAGLRVYKGQVLGPASWPAIVDADKQDRVIALLTSPSRRLSRDGARKHLLSFGIGQCGVCGAELAAKYITSGRKTTKDRRRYPIYYCVGPGCCVSRDLSKVDGLVEAVVIARLQRPDTAGIFDGDDSVAAEARERAEGIRARLDLAADQYAEGDIDGSQLARITARLRPELEAAEQEARRYRRPNVPDAVEGLIGDRATEVWQALPVTAKRAVMEVLGLRVVLLPRTKSGPGFEPESVEILWQ